MERNLKNYIKLFTSTFYLSAFTLGGGYVIVPLMKKKFVDELKWLEEEDMLNMVAIAQSSPGAMAVNASILVGRKLMGFKGILVSIFGTILPPLIILSIVSHFYLAFSKNAIVSSVLKGMMAGVCAVIFDVVITMGNKIIKNKKILPIIIMIGSFVVNFIFHINVMYVIIFCATLGILVTAYDNKTGGKEHL